MLNPSKSTLGLPDPGSTLGMSVTLDEIRDPVMSVGIFFSLAIPSLCYTRKRGRIHASQPALPGTIKSIFFS